MKYLGINLIKYVQDLHEKNYKTLMKEIKEKLDKWRYISCSWIGRLSTIKMSVLLNSIYKFSAISATIPGNYFVDIDKIISKLTN